MSEFSRPERLDTIGEGERRVSIAADAAERAAVARRFGLVSVGRLEGAFAIVRRPDGIAVTGRVTAAVVQACSVTDAPLTAAIDEPVALLFVEGMGTRGAGDDEVELAEDALDVVPIEGGAIDLGETAAETMVLALDPFPRGPGAAAALKAAGVIAEEDVRPLGAFAGLKAKLEGRE